MSLLCAADLRRLWPLNNSMNRPFTSDLLLIDRSTTQFAIYATVDVTLSSHFRRLPLHILELLQTAF
jgi:hypothetical protein